MLYDVEVRRPDRRRRSTGWATDLTTSHKGYALEREAQLRRRGEVVRTVDAAGRVHYPSP